MTNLTIKGHLNQNYIKSAILDVYLLWGIPTHIEEILVVDDPKYFKSIQQRIPLKYRKEFKMAYKLDPTSMSVTAGVFDLIIISISKDHEGYLKHNKKALIGLIAHELMHIQQRRKGLDTEIRNDAIRAFKKFSPKLKKLPYDQRKLADLYASIGENANFTLKDIYDNAALIDAGMGDYILEDYFHLYDIANKHGVRPPQFYKNLRKAEKIHLDWVTDAINFELNLMSAIIPFIYMAKKGRKEENKQAKRLVQFVNKHYEAGIPEIAIAMDPAIQFAAKQKPEWSSRYRQKYFTLIFENIYKLLDPNQKVG